MKTLKDFPVYVYLFFPRGGEPDFVYERIQPSAIADLIAECGEHTPALKLELQDYLAGMLVHEGDFPNNTIDPEDHRITIHGAVTSFCMLIKDHLPTIEHIESCAHQNPNGHISIVGFIKPSKRSWVGKLLRLATPLEVDTAIFFGPNPMPDEKAIMHWEKKLALPYDNYEFAGGH